MVREIYLRNPDDENYDENALEHSNELEILLGQIRMILYTDQGDVLGDFGMGFNLEDKIFLYDLSEDELKSKILNQIHTYCTNIDKFKIDVDVKFFRGSVRDICLIDIIIDDEKRLGVLIK